MNYINKEFWVEFVNLAHGSISEQTALLNKIRDEINNFPEFWFKLYNEHIAPTWTLAQSFGWTRIGNDSFLLRWEEDNVKYKVSLQLTKILDDSVFNWQTFLDAFYNQLTPELMVEFSEQNSVLLEKRNTTSKSEQSGLANVMPALIADSTETIFVEKLLVLQGAVENLNLDVEFKAETFAIDFLQRKENLVSRISRCFEVLEAITKVIEGLDPENANKNSIVELGVIGAQVTAIVEIFEAAYCGRIIETDVNIVDIKKRFVTVLRRYKKRIVD
jgi:hypothetical protein